MAEVSPCCSPYFCLCRLSATASSLTSELASNFKLGSTVKSQNLGEGPKSKSSKVRDEYIEKEDEQWKEHWRNRGEGFQKISKSGVQRGIFTESQMVAALPRPDLTAQLGRFITCHVYNHVVGY